MKIYKKFKEKRQYQRHVITHGAYASLEPTAEKMGPIIDISLGGILFKYLTNRTVVNDPPEKLIYLGSLKYFVSDILFKTIEDIKDSDAPFSKSMVIRKSRIKFELLSPEQFFEVGNFICINTE